MNRILKIVGILTVIGCIIGGIVVTAGLVPIAASSGHWWITRAALEFGKSRAFATQTGGSEVPDLEDDQLIHLGSGAYVISCMPCHGGLNTGSGGIALGMLPQPPHLSRLIEDYPEDELFFVVKNGIKLTGMPAWAAPERDDEVWAVVAFLKSLESDPSVWPKELAGPLDSGKPTTSDLTAQQAIQSCNLCHEPSQPTLQTSLIPNLSGQSEAYLRNALSAYRDRQRSSGIMQSAAAFLDSPTIEALAAHYADLEAPSRATEVESVSEWGRQLAQHGDPDRLIPSCIDCHDPDGAERKPEFPILYGQPGKYLERQLELFKAGTRGGSKSAHLMEEFAHRLEKRDIESLADYFSKTPH